MTDVLKGSYYSGRAAPAGARCPFAKGSACAKEWTKGRNQVRREARKDLRPMFRKGRGSRLSTALKV